MSTESRKAWDEQLEQDFSPGGRGMKLLEEAEAELRAGRTKPMDEFLAEVKARRGTDWPRMDADGHR